MAKKSKRTAKAAENALWKALAKVPKPAPPPPPRGVELMPLYEAMAELGPLLHPGEWIERLTSEERFILEDTRPRPHSAKIEAARERERFMMWQRDKVREWLKRRGVEIWENEEVDMVSASQIADILGRPSLQRKSATGARAPQGEVDAWYLAYVQAETQAGRSPNINEDEAAARKHFADRYDRDKVRSARRRFAPPDWASSGKRKRR